MTRPGNTLPPILAQIADAAGEEAALAIARAHGGTRVKMPAHAGRNWLTRLLGPVIAEAIIDAIGPGVIDVPLGPDGGFLRSRRELTEAFTRLDAQGASESQIARLLGVTGRTVRNRRARRREHALPSAQHDLFSGK